MSNEIDLIPAAFYRDVYDLLARFGQVHVNLYDKEAFVRYFRQSSYQCAEWRFQGTLGYGGKFWRNPGPGRLHYVSAYPEDMADECKQMCDSLNVSIKALEATHNLKVS